MRSPAYYNPLRANIGEMLLTVGLLFALAHVKHVVVIGLDGTSPNGIANAKTPAIDALKARGAWTFHARGVMPTVSSPNWASMIMGAGPEQHGVTSNDWKPEKFPFPPIVKGSGGIFPTMFGVLREARPRAVIGVFHDWPGFGRLLEPKAPDALENPKGPDETAARAIAFIKARKPSLTFVHLDHVDHAGHESGHGTPQYYEAVEKADRLIGNIMDALKQAGMLDSTIVIVTADHGGMGRKHGGETLAELEIPWIIAGPGVRSVYELKDPVNTYDTAATVLYVLGVKQPAAWIAKPVREAFRK